MSDDLLAGLAAAVTALPGDVALRLHYAEQLLAAGRPTEAIEQAGVILTVNPGHPDATALVQRAAAGLGAPAAPAPAPAPVEPDLGAVDWDQHEKEIQSPFQPPFLVVGGDEEGLDLMENFDSEPEMTISRETMTLADVGGLDQVKKRINEAFLEPMRHPEIAKAFGKSLRGGLLLYGPPGCGKTFVARAIAGELNAHFISVTISDILDKFLGESEANMHNVFERARALAPAVLFFDEVDAVGGKRSSATHSSGMRNVVNQMLMEMDGFGSENDGLFVLAATNHPWDVDSALLRPGRFDRMVLVLPPDEPAREAILKVHLKGRPIEGIDLKELVAATDGYSGADLQHVCSTAGEKAMMASIAAGEVRPINMTDLRAALADVKPSIGSWMQSARNVAAYGNASGQYDDLVTFLTSKKML